MSELHQTLKPSGELRTSSTRGFPTRGATNGHHKLDGPARGRPQRGDLGAACQAGMDGTSSERARGERPLLGARRRRAVGWPPAEQPGVPASAPTNVEHHRVPTVDRGPLQAKARIKAAD